MNLIVIPTYDERDNIGGVLDDLLGRPELLDAHVLVVDDASPDGTAGVVRRDRRFGSRVFLLERQAKDGLGAAYRAGFSWALERGYEAVVQMDADGSHPTEAVARLLDGLLDADVVIGSRYVPGGSTPGWSRGRRLVSRCGNAYVRAVLGIAVHDATAGFRAFRADALARVAGPEATSHANGYCFQVETTWQATQRGLRVREVPITFVDRTAGRSKMHAGIVVEALWRVLTWRVEQLAEESRVRTAAREPALRRTGG